MGTKVSASDVLYGIAARSNAQREIRELLVALMERLGKVPYKEFAEGADYRETKGALSTSTATYAIAPSWRITLTSGQWASITYGHPNVLLSAGPDRNDEQDRYGLLEVPVSTVTMVTIRGQLDTLLSALYDRVPQLQHWLSDAIEAAKMTKLR